MSRNNFLWLALFLGAGGTCLAQVVTPWEIKDPELSSLQQQYMGDLQSAGRDILASHFEFPFYLSRKLDLDQAAQQRADQHSIRFDSYNGYTVLAITGNYYAAYSTQKMSEDQRARATFLAVVMPILKGAVPRFQSNHEIQGYAIEVSHHILGNVMGVGMERPENLMVFLPQRAAIRLVGSKNETVQQAALLEGKALLNAQPVNIWLNGEEPPLPADRSSSGSSQRNESSSTEAGAEVSQGDSAPLQTGASESASSPAPKQKETPAAPPPPRDTSPQALASLQTSGQEIIGQMTKELNSQARFVGYAPPRFVVFRQGIYLELSINTLLAESASASRYKLAALAFDEHIAHLVRPTLEYFKADQTFDGVGFSTTVHLAGKTAAASANSEAVEFFFPFSALRCYANYECTGQQLVDEGTVLINGERVSLDLQIAEGGSGR
jgi:hypothetical protein